MSGFWTTLSAMLLVAIFGFFLRPFLPSWARRLKGVYAYLRAKDKELIEHFRNFRWSPQTEDQRYSRTYVLKYIRNWTFIYIPVIVAVGVIFGIIGPNIQRETQSIRDDLIQTLQQHLNSHEEFSTKLMQRTNEYIGPRSVCERSLQSIEQKRAEVLCEIFVESHVSSHCRQGEQSHDGELLRYDTCMLEKGWIVSPCQGSETDCVQIENVGAMCETQHWKTNTNYVGRDCLGYIPEDMSVKSFELQCSHKATQFAFESLYNGYRESDRIHSTIKVYKTCMLANGWTTSECLEVDDPDKDCVKIFYPANPCREKLQKWIEQEGRDYGEIPCNGVF